MRDLEDVKDALKEALVIGPNCAGAWSRNPCPLQTRIKAIIHVLENMDEGEYENGTRSNIMSGPRRAPCNTNQEPPAEEPRLQGHYPDPDEKNQCRVCGDQHPPPAEDPEKAELHKDLEEREEQMEMAEGVPVEYPQGNWEPSDEPCPRCDDKMEFLSGNLPRYHCERCNYDLEV